MPLKNEHLKEKTTEKPKQDAEKPQPFENREPPEILPQTTALPKPEEIDKKNTQTVSDSESDSDPDQTLPDRDPDLPKQDNLQDNPQALDLPRGRTQADPPDTQY
ncbi:MAG: hypothetical protein K2X01_05150 [Cyanobacteria bacterium]|nr:hypothetical protein [Cyanobacteriota bacterium]